MAADCRVSVIRKSLSIAGRIVSRNGGRQPRDNALATQEFDYMPVPGSEVDAGNRVGRLRDLLFVEGHHYSALVRKPYGCI